MSGASNSTTCVIGAGMAGLTTIKALADRGLAVDCYERTPHLGGLWRYREDTAQFSVYQSCHTIGCKHFMQFDEHPIPDAYPEYPSHRQMLEYLESYSARFDLNKHIHFGQEVTAAKPNEQKQWVVTLNNGTAKTYDNLIVGSGQFCWPKLPDYPSNFSGETLHSAFYRRPEQFRGKKILIIGLGNSAVDLVNDLVGVAENILVSTRVGAHFIPKFILGKPFLHYTSPLDDYLPFKLLQGLAHLLNFIGRGSLASFGIAKPKTAILIKNPTISSTFLDHVGHGKVALKPGIRELQADCAVFDDDTRHEIDAVIYATGFKIKFPFFDESLVAYTRRQFRNHLHIFNMEHPNLFFAGFVNPLGTYPKVLELQARCIAGVIGNEIAVPDAAYLRKKYDIDEMKMSRRFNVHDEPMITVDYFSYLSQLRSRIRRKSL